MKILKDGNVRYLTVSDRYYVSSLPLEEDANSVFRTFPDLASAVGSIYFSYFLTLEKYLDDELALAVEKNFPENEI